MSGEAERRVGTVIGGKWRVDSLLGSGSMAAVYAVTHRNGARAALKILHPTLCTDPAVCERFLGEGYLTNSVKHQGIVRVLDDGVTDDGCVFLVMDLLEGETLEQFRQNRGGRLELIEALDMGDRLMDVLAAVHTAGIIHRDLKPQNVFICNDGAVKLLDFGVARVFDRGSQSQLSMFGLVLGTPSFMSPEQALGSRDKVDHRSDIWSLGATLFTALTGETVHLGANMQAKLLAAATVKARSISMVMPDLPAPIASAIDMALRFKKEDRWQTVETFRRAVRESRQKLGLGKPQSVAPPGFDLGFEEITAPVDSDELKYDGSATIPIAPPLPRNVGAPKAAAAMTGTLMGIGVADLARQDQQRGTPPPRPSRLSQPTPHAVVRSPAVSISPQPSRPSGPPHPSRPSRHDGHQDGSILPYSTLKHQLEDNSGSVPPNFRARKGGVAVWLAAFALAAVAIGGIAFFAVHRGPFASPVPPSSASSFPPSLSATSSTVVPSVPSAAVPAATNAITSETAADGGALMKPIVTHMPRSPGQGGTHARNTGHPPVPASPSDPTPAATPDPTPASKPAPSIQPDPFGTPE